MVNEGIGVTLPVSGRSMLPFIIGDRDSVILQRPEHLQVGDVVLAWVDGYRYVVHRIIRIDGEHVTLMGDGNLMGVEHCTPDDVKAVAGYVVGSDGRRHNLRTGWRRVTARWWYHLRPLRRYLLGIYRRTSRNL